MTEHSANLFEWENEMKKLLGYEVTATGNTHEVKYFIKGEREAIYRLIIRHTGGLYALNVLSNICAIKGNYSFSDKSGTLIALS